MKLAWFHRRLRYYFHLKRNVACRTVAMRRPRDKQIYQNHFSAVGIATGYGAGRLRGRGSSPGSVKNFHFSMLPRPALGSTQPPIQRVSGALSRGYSGRGVKLTTHLQLVPMSRKCRSIHPLPHTPSWRSA
jgi:hypothetical protein